MAKAKLHTLYFVKINKRGASHADAVVFCFTAKDEEDAKAKGLSMINPDYVEGMEVQKCEVICKTPDEVLCFEPC